MFRVDDAQSAPLARQLARRIAVPALILTIFVCVAGNAAGAVIHVTTVEQKISDVGGCSLQEAIFSANFDNNIAIARYVTFVLIQCPRKGVL